MGNYTIHLKTKAEMIFWFRKKALKTAAASIFFLTPKRNLSFSVL